MLKTNFTIDVYMGMVIAVIPTTLAELAPAKIRGAMGVLFWLSIKIGGLVVTSIARSTSKVPTDAAWRVPFGLIFVIPLIVSSLIWLTPEPPRWLIMKDRHSEAINNIKRLKNDSASNDQIEYEFNEISRMAAIQLQGIRFGDIFSSPNRQRTFIIIMVNFFSTSHWTSICFTIRNAVRKNAQIS